MIKCYLVTSNYDNNDVQTRGGKFIKRKDYIAKVSNREPLTAMVLDENQNWIPFNTHGCMNIYPAYSFKKYFTVNETFFAKNKKSISELFGSKGTPSYRYSIALQAIYDKIDDHMFYKSLARVLCGEDVYKNKFVI